MAEMQAGNEVKDLEDLPLVSSTSSMFHHDEDNDDHTIQSNRYGSTNLTNRDAAGHQPARPRLGAWCCNKKCCKCCSLATILILIVLIALTAIAIGVLFHMYFAGKVRATTLTQGDYILLDLNTRSDNSLIANLTKYENDAVVDLYKVKCSKLDSYVQERQGCPVRPPKYSIPSDTMTRFRNCSNWPGKCPIDQYMYLLKKKDVSLSFTFTFNSKPHSNMIRFVAYDDEVKFHNFLIDQGTSEALYETYLDYTQNIIFGNNEMVKDNSYYFFAIELIATEDDYRIDWFQVTRDCVIASYGQGLQELTQPYCSLEHLYSTCSISLSLSLTDRSCIIGYYYNATNSVDISDKTVKLDWTRGNRWFEFIVASYSLFGVGAAVLFLLGILICSCCICKIRNRHKKNNGHVHL